MRLQGCFLRDLGILYFENFWVLGFWSLKDFCDFWGLVVFGCGCFGILVVVGFGGFRFLGFGGFGV